MPESGYSTIAAIIAQRGISPLSAPIVSNPASVIHSRPPVTRAYSSENAAASLPSPP
jgi:hypothetical protein